MSEAEEQDLEAELNMLDDVDHEVELEDILEETEIAAELQSSRTVCPIMVRTIQPF